jgi:hypothetical protein
MGGLEQNNWRKNEINFKTKKIKAWFLFKQSKNNDESTKEKCKNHTRN